MVQQVPLLTHPVKKYFLVALQLPNILLDACWTVLQEGWSISKSHAPHISINPFPKLSLCAVHNRSHTSNQWDWIKQKHSEPLCLPSSKPREGWLKKRHFGPRWVCLDAHSDQQDGTGRHSVCQNSQSRLEINFPAFNLSVSPRSSLFSLL